MIIKKDCYWYFSFDEYMYYKSCILYAVKTSYIAPLGAWGKAGNKESSDNNIRYI